MPVTDNSDNFEEETDLDKMRERGDIIDDDEDEDEDPTVDTDEEDDTSDEDTGEDEGTEEDDDEEESKEIPPIPKVRFDEVIAQKNEFKDLWEQERLENQKIREAMQTRLDAIENPAEPEVKFDYDTAEDNLAEAYLEGDTTAVRKIRAEIRAAERAEILAEAETSKTEAVEAARQESGKLDAQRTLKETISTNETKYPFLSKASEDHSEEAVAEVNDLFTAFAKSGLYTQAEALDKAVSLVAPRYAPKGGIGEESDPKARDKKGRKRNARANNAQPPKMKGRTARETGQDDLDPFTTDLKKLSKRELKELRGDFVS